MTTCGKPRRTGALILAAALAVVGSAPLASAETPTAPLSKECQMDALQRSACIFELILADLKATYPFPGGGGITAIKQNSTTSYTASISQEERVDHITYEIAVSDDGTVSIADKTDK